MKKLISFVLLISYSFIGFSQQDFILNGFHHSGGSPDDYVNYINSDNSGSFYVNGLTYQIADLDPGTNFVSYSDPDRFEYLAKYNKSGNYQWSIYYPTDISKAYFIDDSANFTMAGRVVSTTDMDPTTNVENITPFSGVGGFITRYDSSGNFVWNIPIIPTISGCYFEPGEIEVNENGETIIFGLFKGTFDFDPGPNTQTLSSNPVTTYATFYAKYSASGSLIWCYLIANGANSTDITSIALDSQDNIFIGGSVTTSIDVSPNTSSNDIITTVGGETAFIVKYDPNGNYLDSRSLLGNEGTLDYMYINSDDQIIFCGTNIGNSDMDLSASTFILSHVNYKNYIGIYDINFGFIKAWGFGFFNPGTFTFPSKIAIDSVNIYASVCNSSTIKLYKFNKNGDIIWQGSTGGYNTIGELNYRNKTLFLGASFGGTKDVNPHPSISNSITALSPDDDFYWIHVHDCNADSISVTYEICQGDSLFAENNYQFNSGTYYDTLTSSFNCDSVIITHLIVHPTFQVPIYDTINYGDSILFAGIYQNSIGNYYDSLQTINNCDSIIELNLWVNNLPQTFNYYLCSGDSLFVEGNYQFISGQYYDTLTSGFGYDSIIISNLSFGPYNSYDTITICNGDSIFLQGDFQFASGIYFDTLLSTAGCDSTILTNLLLDTCVLVWPGDTNNDSIVNVSDFLSIGIYHGGMGFPRDSISNLWIGHRSFDWPQFQTNGSNIKHVDCDGNGIINLSDTLAINQNFSMTHNFQNSSSRSGFDMNLTTSTTNIYPGDTILVEVQIGTQSNPTNSIYGVAFESIFSSLIPIEPGSLKLIPQNSFLGNLNQDLFGLKHLNESMGESALALTRIDHTSQSGYGSIAQIQFIIDESVNVPSQFDLIILNNIANDEAGNNSDINNLDTLTFNILDPLTVSRIESDFAVEIFPNPNTGEIYFKSESSITQVDIYSIDGKLISNYQFKNGNRQMDVSALPNGSYLLKITSYSSATIRNLVILK
jgi:hypothetical protein